MNELLIELDFLPPSTNCLYQQARNKIYLSSKVREFQKKMNIILDPFEKLTGKVALDITFCFPDSRKRDLDNLLKPLIDSLKHRVIEDDSKVYEITARKVDKCPDPKTTIIIRQM